jgi:TolB-like protein/class 3 adenylate cyclase/Flp pilus assembly protein TadD
MSETRKLAAILCSDVVGYSRLAGADEDRILARLRALRSDLIDPTIAVHHGRVVKRTGDGSIVEFRSVVDAVRCAIEVQNAMVERNAGVPENRRIVFRIGIHIGDVVEESDGDLMGDGVNIAARLEGIAKPGAICLSEDAYRQVKGRLDLAVSDLGNQSLKNIAEPMRVYSLQVGVPVQAKHEKSSVQNSKPLMRLALPAAIATVLAIIVAGAWYVFIAGRPVAPGGGHLSIVVLPFANLSGDASQDYFADGVTENLTTDLSRLSGSFVIARNTAFTYKGKNADARQIGKELGVRYVMEGSVQRDQSQVRVNAQLIDAESGGQLWAQRFDRPLANLFSMQDEIVASLAGQLGAQLITNEARRAERLSNPDSMDLYFQGKAWFNKGHNLDDLAKAREFFERALALDPNNLEASLGTVSVDALSAQGYRTDDRAERYAAVEGKLTKLLSQSPNDAWAHYWVGRIKVETNRSAEGVAEAERALALDPNLASAHALIGLAVLVNGHPEQTEGHELEALRVSPHDTDANIWTAYIALSKLFLGDDEAALVMYRRAFEINPNYPIGHFLLAATLAELGRIDEARAALQGGLALNPGFTIRRYRVGAQSDNPAFLKRREQIIEAMRKAGVPEE